MENKKVKNFENIINLYVKTPDGHTGYIKIIGETRIWLSKDKTGTLSFPVEVKNSDEINEWEVIEEKT